MPHDPRDLAARARAVGARAAEAAAEPRYGSGAPLPGGEPRGLRNPVEAFRAADPVDPRAEPIALVLAGGGARGAYQAGVARCLAEAGTPLVAVSGASIGALNGAILASAPTLADGADRLLRLWTQVARETGRPPFVADDPPAAADEFAEATAVQLLNLLPRLTGPMFKRGFLDDLVGRHVQPAALRAGLPLWVSLFPAVDPDFGSVTVLLDRITRGRRPHHGPLHASTVARFGWLLDLVRAKALGAKADWMKVNDLSDEAVAQAILASAAVPLLLPPRNVDGKTYRDGGFADNVPIGALAGLSGCRHFVVVHLNHRPLFDPAHHPGLAIVEVMPSRPVDPRGPLGAVSGLVDLSPARVDALCELGYQDAARQLGRVWQQRALAQAVDFMGDFRRDAVAELSEPLRGAGELERP